MMRKILAFVLLLICLSVTSVAQVGSGMTDKQVVEYVQNGLLQGKSQQQISTELARRGVTKEQAERVKLLNSHLIHRHSVRPQTPRPVKQRNGYMFRSEQALSRSPIEIPRRRVYNK